MHAKDPKDQINASEGLIFLCKGKSIGILIFFKIVQHGWKGIKTLAISAMETVGLIKMGFNY